MGLAPHFLPTLLLFVPFLAWGCRRAAMCQGRGNNGAGAGAVPGLKQRPQQAEKASSSNFILGFCPNLSINHPPRQNPAKWDGVTVGRCGKRPTHAGDVLLGWDNGMGWGGMGRDGMGWDGMGMGWPLQPPHCPLPITPVAPALSPGQGDRGWQPPVSAAHAPSSGSLIARLRPAVPESLVLTPQPQKWQNLSKSPHPGSPFSPPRASQHPAEGQGSFLLCSGCAAGVPQRGSGHKNGAQGGNRPLHPPPPARCPIHTQSRARGWVHPVSWRQKEGCTLAPHHPQNLPQRAAPMGATKTWVPGKGFAAFGLVWCHPKVTSGLEKART
ncbi:uncharacterized protein LOC118178155 [Oxyura jamaicensis]|uniref:uncharacterized protein LOC118178155 n=1 Tax=Oxyura jamaicensis TaxID=8884 RepID=UPI0015A5D304|nr:uncharacterized protein LOC118178155 [Oxyura jamaicensis]